MRAVELKSNGLRNPIGISASHVFFSWYCEDGSPAAYQIEIKQEDNIILDTGKVETDCMHASFDLNANSKDRYTWQVRLFDEMGNAGEWSTAAWFEYGLLHASDWQAEWITAELITLKKGAGHQPAGVLKKCFELANTENSRMYITAHGIYRVMINGKEMTDTLLSPGPSEYEKQLPVQTYDISSFLCTGKNTIIVTLGDGWYRSTSGVDGDRNLFGSDESLLLQLDIDGRTVVKTDGTWQASTDGPIRMNDLQQGEIYDARMEEISDWHEAKVLPLGYETLIGTDELSIKGHEVLNGKIIKTPNGDTVLDFGQNIAGQISFEIFGHAGDEIIFQTGETLDENGNFTQENFQDRKRHKEGGTQQKIEYICKEGMNQYQSRFTIMGFRYAKIDTALDLSHAVFHAVAVYSDMQDTAEFISSNEDLNQLFRNAVWSMKGNFCGIPTDCPTRERAGWTGDAGVFVTTGLELMDSYPVFRKWLKDCRTLQYEDGRIANIAPRNNRPTMFSGMLAGSVGWGDACIKVPYAMYQYTGDTFILRENYHMMRKWYEYLENRAEQKPLKKLFSKNPYEKYTVDSGIDYGEWCEPGVGTEAMRDPNKSVGTAYLYYSGKLLSEIAGILGKQADTAHFQQVSQQAQKAYHAVFTEHGRIHSDRQAEYVRAISFGLLNEAETKQAAADLNAMVIANKYHLNTGFLSTPYLCQVLANHGYVDTAYQLLLQTDSPSWLYAVKKGATTIWETWNGIDENNHPSNSLNHYSYGAVCGWLLNGICGIHYQDGSVIFQPVINPRLSYAKGSVTTPCGRISSGWQMQNHKAVIACTIPDGVKAKIILPDGTTKALFYGKYEFETEVSL